MMDNKIETTDNGEIEVQIAPIGKFNGSDANGDAVPENITKESLDVLANRLNATNEEVLVDVDHASVRPGLDRDTRAVGWLSKFFTTVKGLFAKMKLTGHGKKLVEEREFRYLSPVFTLGSSGEPVELHSVAFTNTPAFTGAINPIVNHEPIQEKQMEIEDMSKEELIGLIKETVKAMNSEEKVEEVVEETKDEVVSPTEETTKEEVVENACVENTCSEENDVKNSETETEVEETKEEEVKEEIKEEAKPEVEDEEEEEEKEEVIKIDALNSKPTALGDVSGKENWMNLHGEAFWKYLAEHPELTR